MLYLHDKKRMNVVRRLLTVRLLCSCLAGDHAYKRNTDLPLSEQMITALPDVKSLTLTDEDEFMVIACDGIW